MTTSPIRYTSRTFTSVMNDINSDVNLVDKPEWFKRIWAGVGDMLSMIENASANQSFLRTAFTRQAVIDLCELLDYDLTPRVESSGTLLFYLKGTTAFPVTILAKDMTGRTVSTIVVASKKFEARTPSTIAASSETFVAVAGDDKLTVARVYTTGEKVRLTTAAADLPSPLLINTDYYVIYVDATHIRLATTLLRAYAGLYIDILDAGTPAHTIHLYSFPKICYQQESISTAISLGTADASTEWQEFSLPHSWVLKNTLVITINAVVWTRVDTFVNSLSTDTHFKLIYDKDGRCKIRFGDGAYGVLPGAFAVYAMYAYGGGADGNVGVANRVSLYAGSDANIEGISNPSILTGGANEESIESAKYLAPLLLKARDRFVTVEDGEALAKAYGGVSIVTVNSNVYGLLSAQVIIVPTGGGVPTAPFKALLQTYLIDRTILGSIDVRVEDPTYNTRNVTSAMKVKTGYVFASILPLYTLCVRLLMSEYTTDIVEDYLTNGIESAVLLINTKWAITFTSVDYPQIQVFLEEIEGHGLAPYFGQTHDQSETLGFINMFIDGVDYVTWAAPAFPITNAVDEISTDGAMTLTEI